MPEIYLIGTNHVDLHGPQRLNLALEEIVPDIVLAEGDFNKDHARINYLGFLRNFLRTYHIEEELAQAVIEKQKRLGYESAISKKYTETHGKKFDYLKDKIPTPNVQKLKVDAKNEVKELLINRIKLVRFNEKIQTRQKRIDSDWDYMGRTIGTKQERIDAQLNINASKDMELRRDKKMEGTLKFYLERSGQIKIATVTGFIHILDDPQNRTFYTLIKHLNPTRRFLFE